MRAEILQPLVVLAAWSMIMWLWLYASRLPAMRRAGLLDANMVGLTGRSVRDDMVARGEVSASWKADNYNHLMEQPTVFYAVVIALALMGHGDGLNLTLAWIYVAFRIVHSLVQVTFNRVVVRFSLHVLGTVPLLMLVTHAVIAAFSHG